MELGSEPAGSWDLGPDVKVTGPIGQEQGSCPSDLGQGFLESPTIQRISEARSEKEKGLRRNSQGLPYPSNLVLPLRPVRRSEVTGTQGGGTEQEAPLLWENKQRFCLSPCDIFPSSDYASSSVYCPKFKPEMPG